MGENRVLKTTRAFSGRLINVDLEEIRLASGVQVELEIIRHPGASAVVPVVALAEKPDPDVLLIKQFRHAAGGTIWEIPAGVLNKNEDPEDCARRELEEETGARAENIEHLGTILTTPGFTDERIHLFLASGLEIGDSNQEEDEEIEVVNRPFSEVLRMVRDGTICDSKSIAGILLAKERLHFQDPGVRIRTQ